MKGFIAGIIATVLVGLFGADRVAAVLDSIDAAAKRSLATFEQSRQRPAEPSAPVWRRRAP